MNEKYIVWQSYGSEGWQPSQEFDTLQEAIEFAIKENYSSDIKITKNIIWKAVEKQNRSNSW